MKKLLSILFVAVYLVACTNNNKTSSQSPTLLGKWKLIQVLNDPGDGSGVFKDTQNGKTLEFLSEGKVTSNTPMCVLNSSSGAKGEGTYDKTSISPKDCGSSTMKLTYKIEGQNLIVTFPCDEGCAEKYVKL